MKNEIEQLKEVLIEAITNFKPPAEEKFEVGKWYKNKNNPLSQICLYMQRLNNFGIYNNGKCRTDFMMDDISLWTLATDQEVLTAFTNYFRSKGFVSGKSRFRSPYTGTTQFYKEPLLFHGDGSIVSQTNGVLFDKPTLTLATLIEEEKIMVGENEVVFENGWCVIGGKMFDVVGIEKLLPANLELFQKILDRLDK